MLKNRGTFLAAATVALTLGTALPAAADTTVHADLVEQNQSGVHGTATVTATDDGALRVDIQASGLMPGPHAQHLHGTVHGGSFHCATLQEDDEDGDGWLTNEEASGEYGSVLLALTTRGDTSGPSALALDRMPVADANGRLTYHRTIPPDLVPDGVIENLSTLHVVQHGIDANNNGKYDLDALGESTFAAGLGMSGVPEEATDPAACGVVTGAGAGHAPMGGVETGSGATDGVESLPLAALGVGVLGLAAVVWRRRMPGTSGANRA